MTDAPKRIWAEPPDIFDGMGFWRDASFPTRSPYILATPAADLWEQVRQKRVRYD